MVVAVVVAVAWAMGMAVVVIVAREVAVVIVVLVARVVARAVVVARVFQGQWPPWSRWQLR